MIEYDAIWWNGGGRRRDSDEKDDIYVSPGMWRKYSRYEAGLYIGMFPDRTVTTRIISHFLDPGSLVKPQVSTVIRRGEHPIQYKIDGWKLQVCANKSS